MPKNAQTTAQLHSSHTLATAAATAKSCQSCSTLCDPIDSGPPGSHVLGIPQARTLEWVAISSSNACKWKVKGKSLSHIRLFATPWTAAYQAPPSMGFARQEYCSKVMLKILQARLQHYMNHELPDVQAGFRKSRGIRNQITNICWIIEKSREFQKNIYFCFLTMPKALTMWITINCGKFWKRWEYQTTLPASWEICMQVKKQQLELDMEQQTGSK